MNDLNANLSRIMIREGLRPAQLARLTGVQKSTLSQLASGRSEPRSSTIVKLAGALQCTTDELLGVKALEVSRPVLVFEIAQMVHEMGVEDVAAAHDAVSEIHEKGQSE